LSAIRPSKSVFLTFDEIDFPTTSRAYNATGVAALVQSIRAIGLMVPLTVVERDGRYLLIAGRHRLEALRVIGEERVPARVVDFDDIEARLWTISENLHRTELSAVHRSEQIAEFARLVKERQEGAQLGEKVPPAAHEGVSAQVAQKPQGGRPEGGDSLAARELGITREEVRRSQAIGGSAGRGEGEGCRSRARSQPVCAAAGRQGSDATSSTRDAGAACGSSGSSNRAKTAGAPQSRISGRRRVRALDPDHDSK